MKKEFTAKQAVFINAPASRVWDALTKPEHLKEAFFGADVISDWKKGSPIIYKGVWKDKPFEDRGVIQEIEPERLLVTTYYSPLSGKPDTPENHHLVTYELTPDNAGTHLTVTQENNHSEEEKNHSEQNWKVMLGTVKKIAER